MTVAGEDNDFVTDLIRSVCKPYGFTPKIQPVHSTDAMIMGVQCGLGVAVTDAWSRALDNPGFASLVLESTHPLSVVWKNEEKDPAIDCFVELLKTRFSSIVNVFQKQFFNIWKTVNPSGNRNRKRRSGITK